MRHFSLAENLDGGVFTARNVAREASSRTEPERDSLPDRAVARSHSWIFEALRDLGDSVDRSSVDLDLASRSQFF
jgi:hypothetical protein